MKQNIFETRQRAQELLEEAINFWRQSPQSEALEGLGRDPVMTLLMSALAYQANETDNDIEMLKTEVIDEYVHALTPYELGHAMPATTVVETALQDNYAEWEVDTDSVFKLSGSEYTLMPILRSKVINASVESITRLDGRRWKVDLGFKAPIINLSGFTFAINNLFFEDLKVSYKGTVLPIIKPWQYSKLPLAKCFSLDSALYNGSQTFNPSMIAMDLYARQNVRLFCVKEHNPSLYMTSEIDSMSLVFEFSGITDRFEFDKKQLSLNCIMLANAQLQQASLPIARVAGYSDTEKQGSSQFVHLIRPSEEQLFGKIRVEVRRIFGDRFNQGSLMRLLNALLNKYHSDFYAFQNQKELADDGTMHNLQDILNRLSQACQRDINRSKEGVYLLLHQDNNLDMRNMSLNIDYLVTQGAAINSELNEESTFLPPAAFVASETRQIVSPLLGADEISDKVCETSLVRYHIITNDRIVTPADIKAFCYNELLSRYGIDKEMVKSINVGHRLETDPHGCGYEILTEIVLVDTPFVRRSFTDKIAQTEILIQKMMEVRSTNIYPIRVSISISDVN